VKPGGWDAIEQSFGRLGKALIVRQGLDGYCVSQGQRNGLKELDQCFRSILVHTLKFTNHCVLDIV